jgi:hypothetical protein
MFWGTLVEFGLFVLVVGPPVLLHSLGDAGQKLREGLREPVPTGARQSLPSVVAPTIRASESLRLKESGTSLTIENRKLSDDK